MFGISLVSADGLSLVILEGSSKLGSSCFLGERLGGVWQVQLGRNISAQVFVTHPKPPEFEARPTIESGLPCIGLRAQVVASQPPDFLLLLEEPSVLGPPHRNGTWKSTALNVSASGHPLPAHIAERRRNRLLTPSSDPL